ncbi:acyl-CoA dehydrogenase family protein [Phenylobacterium sp.]|uniref:acyl-CoA dehydrogenase family protein n=1 Tax=Phenylobacterium sp. TaxID=1871053 RepID=UPI00301E1361
MNFDLTEEQQLLKDSADRFVREALCLKPVDQRPHHAEIWARMAELGWLGLPLPERAGGLDGSFEDVLVLMTALGRGVVSTAYVSNIVLGGHLLAGSQGNPLADELLAKLATGEARVAFADTDSVDGSVRACRTPDGGYVLEGRKVLSHDAPHASAALVTADLAGGTDRALFLVRTNADGVSLDAYPVIDGGAAGDLSFRGASVPGTALLARGAAAAGLVGEAKDRAVLANLAQIVGAAEACLDVCSEYLKVREQFGRPLGKFQALQHKISAMYVEAQEARSILYYGAASIDGPSEVRAGAVREAHLVIAEAGKLISEGGIQLHGGYGVTDEFAISHYYRRIMTLTRMFDGRGESVRPGLVPV